MGRLVFLAPLGVATFLFVGSLGVLIAAPASAASSGWGSPYPLEVEGRGSLKDLNVAVDANGGGFIAWIQDDARGSVWAARLLPDLGARSATPISGPGYAADLEFAVDARGNAVAAWSQDYDGTTAVYASQFDVQAKTWDAPALINPVSRLEGLTMDPGGNATIAGSQWNGDSWDLWASRLESGMEWNDPVVLAPEYR